MPLSYRRRNSRDSIEQGWSVQWWAKVDGRQNHLRDVVGISVIRGTAILTGGPSLFGWIVVVPRIGGGDLHLSYLSGNAPRFLPYHTGEASKLSSYGKMEGLGLRLTPKPDSEPIFLLPPEFWPLQERHYRGLVVLGKGPHHLGSVAGVGHRTVIHEDRTFYVPHRRKQLQGLVVAS